jgi:plasmid rolling circle replication initiator protein Rep
LAYTFNTLAQSGTVQTDHHRQKAEKMVFGEGTDRNNVKALKGRAKRKTITQSMILHLIDVVKAKGDNERVQTLWNAYHCQSSLVTSKNKMYGNYCKTRFCTTCLSIRKAEIINKYYPVIQQWEEPYFVTLTVKAVQADKLPKWVKAMKVAFKRMKERCKKRHQRGKCVKLVGIKSLECNFNPKTKTYNPHFHLIVANKAIADVLVVEWQRTWNKKEKLTSAFAQDSRKITNKQAALIETIKYGSKIFTEPDVRKKKNSTIPPKVYAAALDNIFYAMKGSRLFDRFGFNLPKQTSKPKAKTTFLDDAEEWEYDPSANDWVNHNTGELLTGHVIDHKLAYLLRYNFDVDLE